MSHCKIYGNDLFYMVFAACKTYWTIFPKVGLVFKSSPWREGTISAFAVFESLSFLFFDMALLACYMMMCGYILGGFDGCSKS